MGIIGLVKHVEASHTQALGKFAQVNVRNEFIVWFHRDGFRKILDFCAFVLPLFACNFRVALSFLHLKTGVMNYLQRVEHWGDTHHPKYLDLLRIVLGIFLLFKGIEFARNSTTLNELISQQVPFSSLLLVLLGHYVIFAHIMGGFLLALGLLTRLACLIQIPILIGAIVFVNVDLTNHFSEIILSIGILGLLIYFTVIGSGPWSLDRVMDRDEEERQSRSLRT